MSKTLRELTLATETVTGDLYHVSGTDLLDKRVTIDDITTAVRGTLKGPLVADGNVTIETGGLLLARANEDVIQEIGRVKVWGAGDIAYVSHYDFATASGAGWQQNASGDAYLNGASGRTAGLRIANGDIITATATAIALKKNTAVTGTLGVSGLSTLASLTVTGAITQTSGVTSLKATTITGLLTAVGDITQTSGVTSLKATTVTGLITSDTGVNIKNNGSSGVLVGPYFRLLNDPASAQIAIQLNAIGGLDTWIYSGAVWTKRSTLSSAGRFVLGGSTDNEADLLQIGFNTDRTASVGYSRLGSGGGIAYFSHISHSDAFNQALKHTSTGATILNFSTGQSLGVYENATTLLMSVTGTAIALNKPVGITGALTCTTIDTGQGATLVYLMNQNVRTSSDVGFASITNGGLYLPTNAPTESTETSLTDGQTHTIQRGSWSAIGSSTSTGGTMYLERKHGASWFTVDSITGIASKCLSAGAFSSGTNLRYRFSGTGSGSIKLTQT